MSVGFQKINHSLYPSTNADNTYTNQKIEGLERKGTVLVGTADLSILSTVALKRPGKKIEQIFLFDISIETLTFWTNLQQALKECESRKEFIAWLQQELLQSSYFANRDQYQAAIEDVNKEIANEKSWLNLDEAYAEIRELVLQNRFSYIELDFFDAESVKDFLFSLDSKDVDILYLSNMFAYCRELKDFKGFYKSYKCFQKWSSEAIVIRNQVEYPGSLQQTVHVCISKDIPTFRFQFLQHAITIPSDPKALEYVLHKKEKYTQQGKTAPEVREDGLTPLHTCGDDKTIGQVANLSKV